MTVLVTGARGDVGGAVLAGLAAAGEPVRASSRAPRPASSPAASRWRADLADPASWPACARCSFTRIPIALRATIRRSTGAAQADEVVLSFAPFGLPQGVARPAGDANDEQTAPPVSAQQQPDPHGRDSDLTHVL